MKVELWAHTPNPEKLIERAARNCYKSEEKGDKAGGRLVRSCIRRGHESVIEHVSFTFYAEGISRACSHQLVRHRMASYSQESQRYTDPTKHGVSWVVPPDIANDHNSAVLFQEVVEKIEGYYSWLVENGMKKQDARFLLPNACPTSVVLTMNCRALRNFFRLRLDKHAQWEIRELAQSMFRACLDVCPNVFEDLTPLVSGEAA